MGSCAAPSAKGDDKFITTDYLQQCRVLQPPWGNQGSELRAAALPGQRPQPGDGGYRAVEHGVPGTRHPGVGRGRQAGGRRAAAIPVAAGLGAHQPNRRLRLAAEPQTGRREVSALTDARKTLAYDFFRILRAPLIKLNAFPAFSGRDNSVVSLNFACVKSFMFLRFIHASGRGRQLW